MKHDILIVEDEDDIREIIAGILADEDYGVRVAATSEDALNEVKARVPSLVVLDVWLKGSSMDGIELLDVLKKDHPNLPIIVISRPTAPLRRRFRAIRKGAFDYIVKPFKSEKLLITVSRALENARLRRENEELKGRSATDDALIGSSPAITQIRSKIKRIAPTNSRVLINGPSGAGKELVARLIHASSDRASGPFMPVNAASMVPDRVEQELFGIVQ